jgi:hypothetical protein
MAAKYAKMAKAIAAAVGGEENDGGYRSYQCGGRAKENINRQSKMSGRSAMAVKICGGNGNQLMASEENIGNGGLWRNVGI